MKLKIVQGQTTSFSQNEVILMTNYEVGGKTKKFIGKYPANSVIDVEDELGLALLHQPHYKGILKMATAEDKAVEAPRNKMVSKEDSK